jgi:hexosaminidase
VKAAQHTTRMKTDRLFRIIRIVAVSCMAAGWTGCATREPVERPTVPPLPVIPAPAEVTRGTGSFELTAATPVRFGGGAASEPVATYFIDLVQRSGSFALRASAAGAASETPSIDFQLSASEGASGDEGYSLVVSPERIVVSARAPRGLFYGAVTLWQLVTAQRPAERIQLAAVSITDSPRFAWRGLMLDSARHYQSPAFIKRFIDVMALHKLNVFHWHLTDDQAWRLEIKKYPKLTSVGAWRVPAGPAALEDIDPATGKPRLYGGFYTQEQVREIVAYAAAKHITVLPEIEMPGHASAPVAAYPELGVDSTLSQVPADWGIYENLFNVEDSTFAFLEAVLDEVITLFPSVYIHVGGDEAVKKQWHASARVQERMRALGVENEEALQSYFIARIEKFLNSRGRRLIGWDEILEGGLAPNATVMSWRGIDGAIAAASAGHDAVLTPWPTLYFDNRPYDSASPPGRGAVISVEDVYRFDPSPAALNEAQRRHILGVQANLWTEHIRTEDRVEYMAFPRAAAIAEVGWSAANRIDWPSFSQRLPAQLARYEALGIGFARAPTKRPRRPGSRTSHELSSCTEKLVLSLEDDAPVRGERAIFLVDIMNPCWIYPAADLSPLKGIAASVGQVPFNFQIGDAVKQIQLRKPATDAGELEVRLDRCDGQKIATLPLAPAVGNHAVTRLPAVAVEPLARKHDLCFVFTQTSVDPTWVIHEVELIRE